MLEFRRVLFRRSEEHTSELQSHDNLVCRLLLETKTTQTQPTPPLTSQAASPSAPPPRRAPLRRAAAPRPAKRGTPLSRASVLVAFFFNLGATHEVHPFSPPGPLPV